MRRLVLIVAVLACDLLVLPAVARAAAIDERIMQTIIEDVSCVAGADGS